MRWAIALIMAVGLWGGAWGSAPALAQNVHQAVGNIVVPAGQTHHGNIELDMGNVTVRGREDGNIRVDMGNVTVYGVVTGNVSVGTGNAAPKGSGRIEGKTSVTIGNNGGVGSVSSLGSTPSHLVSHPFGIPSLLQGVGWTARFAGALIVNLIVAGVLILLFPRMIRQIVQGMEEAPARAAALGCLTLAAWVVAMIGLAIIIIGIPLTILLALAGVAAFLMANGAVVWLVGSRIMRSAWPQDDHEWYLIILVGGIAVTLVEIIPVIGRLAELAVVVLGVGAMVHARFGWKRRQ